MRKLLLGAALFASAVSGSVHAASIVQNGVANPTQPTPTTFQYFDSNLGTLLSTTFSQTFDVIGTLVFTNTGSTAASGVYNAQLDTQLFPNITDSRSSLASVVLGAASPPPFVRAITYSLAPGQTATYTFDTGLFSSSSTYSVPSGLAALSSPGGGLSSAFAVIGAAVTPTSSVAISQSYAGGGTYSFAYNYAPAGVAGAVPEPATWAMMILGMGAVGFAMRSAKRRSDEKFDAKIKRITQGIA